MKISFIRWLMAALVKLLKRAGTKELLRWAVIEILKVIVDSNANKVDSDAFYKILEIYDDNE